MKRLALAAMILVGPLGGATVAADTGSAPGRRVATVLGGVGNAMGWYGIQGERYLGAGRLSLFGGLGYTPELETGQATGISLAAGARAFTPGTKHRGFVELSVSQIAAEVVPAGSQAQAESRPYGPGLQLGYQHVIRRGFTVLISAGVGYAVGGPPNVEGTHTLLGFGLGYTWRR